MVVTLVYFESSENAFENGRLMSTFMLSLTVVTAEKVHVRKLFRLHGRIEDYFISLSMGSLGIFSLRLSQ